MVVDVLESLHLLQNSLKIRKLYFYTATKVGKNRNLELFSKQVLDLFMPGVEDVSFNTIEAVFDFIDKNMGNDKLILVIDELPYWARKRRCTFICIAEIYRYCLEK